MSEIQRVRGIFENTAYERMKAEYGDSRFMDDIQTGFDLVLGRNPYYGSLVPGTNNLRVFQTTGFPPRIPVFRVLYRFDPANDPDNVELLGIEPLIQAEGDNNQ